MSYFKDEDNLQRRGIRKFTKQLILVTETGLEPQMRNAPGASCRQRKAHACGITCGWGKCKHPLL